AAQRRNPFTEPSIFSFIEEALIPLNAGKIPPEEFHRQLEFAMKFQQYTGPVQAKGMEDTAFYRYHALVSLNEVGGDPDRFGRAPERFHQANLERRREWPLAMLATATHDTKRGEDARARIDVLSEMPEDWDRAVTRWSQLNAECRSRVEDAWAPEPNEEYLFYQALLGAWPADSAEESKESLAKRLQAYMAKAIKEAQVHTSWMNPHDAYEKAVEDFVARALLGPRSQAFWESFIPFARRVARAGMMNSLSQVALKIASPGVCDFYQGTELWDLSLVDPDNRRPVDYALRQKLLQAL